MRDMIFRLANKLLCLKDYNIRQRHKLRRELSLKAIHDVKLLRSEKPTKETFLLPSHDLKILILLRILFCLKPDTKRG